MSDIFISYKREEQSMARKLADSLEKKGWSVWWDPKLRAGEHFDDAIERALNDAKCVIVVWSKLSVKSRYVKDEATHALNCNKLVPIAIEDVNLPFRFEGIQTEQLINWDGSDSFPGYQKLVTDIVSILGTPPVDLEERGQEEAEKERRQKDTKAEGRRNYLVQLAKKETNAESVEKEPPLTGSKTPRIKRLAFGVSAIALVVILSVIGWFFYSKKPQYPKTFKNSFGAEFVLIPAGSFTMGSSPGIGEASERPSHTVKITRPFYLQKTEVSQGQWEKVMEDNPSNFKECGGNCPVESVSWEDTQKFIKKLNEMEGTNKYRLPSEAEWEYAGRAGTTTLFSLGDDENKLTDYAWFRTNSDSKTHRVTTKKPNPWGLYDMHGNVREWVEDDWHDNYNGAPDNGHAWIDEPRGVFRVMRGGGWSFFARECRSAFRYAGPPDFRNYVVGFRLARSVDLDSWSLVPLAILKHEAEGSE